MKKLLIATTRKDKTKEIKEILHLLPLQILTLNDIKIPKNFSIKENGKTFEENAIKKAKAYGNFSKILTLADDSGLCVDALSGKPGIKSARYTIGNDKNRIRKLLSNLKKIPPKKRTAHFISVVALYNPKDGKIKIERGECHGKILTTPRGTKGFGYDPIFYLPKLGRTLAQISRTMKNKHSHRGKAIRKIKSYLIRNIKNV